MPRSPKRTRRCSAPQPRSVARGEARRGAPPGRLPAARGERDRRGADSSPARTRRSRSRPGGWARPGRWRSTPSESPTRWRGTRATRSARPASRIGRWRRWKRWIRRSRGWREMLDAAVRQSRRAGPRSRRRTRTRCRRIPSGSPRWSAAGTSSSASPRSTAPALDAVLADPRGIGARSWTCWTPPTWISARSPRAGPRAEAALRGRGGRAVGAAPGVGGAAGPRGQPAAPAAGHAGRQAGCRAGAARRAGGAWAGERCSSPCGSTSGSTPSRSPGPPQAGELSRLMLALKVVLARHDAIATLVFDEVDQGIGGEVGAQVGGAAGRGGGAAPGAGDHPPSADRGPGRPAPGGVEGGRGAASPPATCR